VFPRFQPFGLEQYLTGDVLASLLHKPPILGDDMIQQVDGPRIETTARTTHVTTILGETYAIPLSRTVVAIVVECRGKIALFRRSRHLGHDRGLWHCITGFVEVGIPPGQQAVRELFEETGLQPKDLIEFREGPALVIKDLLETPWLVHTFIVLSNRRRLTIDWEHDAYRWALPGKTRRFSNRVSWLDTVLGETGYIPTSSYSGSRVLGQHFAG
jgi:8-oxo-dGTP pyrophosphatase MutT (NUDIX family)